MEFTYLVSMNIKHNVIGLLSCLGIYGLFYLLYKLGIETILVGVFRELLIIPSFFGAIFFAFTLAYALIKQKTRSKN
jgi:hypothetical protein